MNIRLAKMYAVLVSTLAIMGLFVKGHLLELMNTDMVLDGMRVLLAAYLIYAAFISKAENTVNTALTIVGVLYVGMGLAGLVSPTLGGVLPSGLTGFDIMFHLATGLLATYAGLHRDVHMPSHSR